VQSVKHTRAKERRIRPTGRGEKVFFWIELWVCVVKRGQEGCKRQAWVREEKREPERERRGMRKQYKNTENVPLVGYKMKDSNSTLPVRSY